MEFLQLHHRKFLAQKKPLSPDSGFLIPTPAAAP